MRALHVPWRGDALWSRDLDRAGIVERAWLTVARVAVVVARGVSRHRLAARAAALSFTTVFSLVPALAVAFAMFKSFGGLEHATETVLPRILDYLAVGVRAEAEAFLPARDPAALRPGTLLRSLREAGGRPTLRREEAAITERHARAADAAEAAWDDASFADLMD